MIYGISLRCFSRTF